MLEEDLELITNKLNKIIRTLDELKRDTQVIRALLYPDNPITPVIKVEDQRS